jgi:hypothetical protein
MMTTDRGPGWNKIIAVCGSFGIPLVGMAYALTVTLTHISDRIERMELKQQEQSIDTKDIKDDVNFLKSRIDTIERRQERHQRDNNYRFELWEHGAKPKS